MSVPKIINSGSICTEINVAKLWGDMFAKRFKLFMQKNVLLLFFYLRLLGELLNNRFH